MMIPWWAIVLGVITILIIAWIVKGMAVASRCRNAFKARFKIVKQEVDEDTETGDGENH